MASKYGAMRGEPQYDRFRTGLTFSQVRSLMLGTDDPATWRHKRRRSVLGSWHQLKLEMYRNANPDTRL